MTNKKCSCGRALKYHSLPGAIIEVLPCECGRSGRVLAGKDRQVQEVEK